MLCVIVLQLHLCMLTKLAPESYLQKCKDCPCYSSWESGNDNCYGGKSPLHGIDFFICPTACQMTGQVFPRAGQRGAVPAARTVAALGRLRRDRQQAGLSHRQPRHCQPRDALGGHEWPTAAFRSGFEAGVEGDFKKTRAAAMSGGMAQ